MKPVLISLFDYTGNWSKPYKNAGWNVIKHDLKTGQCIFEDTIPAAIADNLEGRTVTGIIAANPCTDFAGSGARWWKEKDNMPAPYDGEIPFDNRLDFFAGMVQATLFVVELLKPKFYCIENPVGRIHKVCPEIGKPKMYFQPWHYGDTYTKKTALYGNFNTSLPTNPVFPFEGSKMHSQYGGKSEKTKAARSITPVGFSNAFYAANGKQYLTN